MKQPRVASNLFSGLSSIVGNRSVIAGRGMQAVLKELLTRDLGRAAQSSGQSANETNRRSLRCADLLIEFVQRKARRQVKTDIERQIDADGLWYDCRRQVLTLRLGVLSLFGDDQPCLPKDADVDWVSTRRDKLDIRQPAGSRTAV